MLYRRLFSKRSNEPIYLAKEIKRRADPISCVLKYSFVCHNQITIPLLLFLTIGVVITSCSKIESERTIAQGISLQKKKNYVAALEEYRKAKELNPSDDRPYKFIGQICMEIGHKECFITNAKDAYKLSPNDSENRLAMSIACLLESEIEKAVEYKKGSGGGLFSFRPLANAHSIELYNLKGEHHKARKILKRLLNRYDRSDLGPNFYNLFKAQLSITNQLISASELPENQAAKIYSEIAATYAKRNARGIKITSAEISEIYQKWADKTVQGNRISFK